MFHCKFAAVPLCDEQYVKISVFCIQYSSQKACKVNIKSQEMQKSFNFNLRQKEQEYHIHNVHHISTNFLSKHKTQPSIKKLLL